MRAISELQVQERLADILYRHQRGTTPRTEDVEFLLTHERSLRKVLVAQEEAVREARKNIQHGIEVATTPLDSLFSAERQLRRKGEAMLSKLREAKSILAREFPEDDS